MPCVVICYLRYNTFTNFVADVWFKLTEITIQIKYAYCLILMHKWNYVFRGEGGRWKEMGVLVSIVNSFREGSNSEVLREVKEVQTRVTLQF